MLLAEQQPIKLGALETRHLSLTAQYKASATAPTRHRH